MAGTGARGGRSPERPSDKLNAVGRPYVRWSSRLARTKPATASRRCSSISRIPTHLGRFAALQAPRYWPHSVNVSTLPAPGQIPLSALHKKIDAEIEF
jgi:hypothetical protein